MDQPDNLLKDTGDDTARLVYFSDAIIAVALTLLVIGLRVPQITRDSDLLGALAQSVWPSLLALVISFVVISAFWRTHHRIFNQIARYDSTLISLNFLFLLGIVLQPFTTELLSAYGNTAVAVALYASLLGVTMLLLTAIERYATHARLLREPDRDPRLIRFRTLRTLTPGLIFLVTAGLAFIMPPFLVPYLWLLIMPAHRLLVRWLRRKPATAAAR